MNSVKIFERNYVIPSPYDFLLAAVCLQCETKIGTAVSRTNILQEYHAQAV